MQNTQAKKFALTGVAGFVAPRHLEAIRAVGGNLVAALDPHDAVGILDAYFPNCDYFAESERFERHLEKLKRANPSEAIDYLSICSPNYLHDAHIRMALRTGADAICEKPLVLNPWNIDLLEELELETNRRIYNVLQLRLHSAVKELYRKYQQTSSIHDVELTYIAPRGKWYDYSWKGSVERSGGVCTNIGIHFFDMLIWIFGGVEQSELHFQDEHTICGCLTLRNAVVKWFLSVDKQWLPSDAQGKSYRKITVDSHEVNFSEGFANLHTEVYKEIMLGKGFSTTDTRPSIELVHRIRNQRISANTSLIHPFTANVMR